MIYINSVTSISTLVELFKKHKSLSMQDVIDNLKIDISKDVTFYDLHKMFLNAYKMKDSQNYL